MVLSNEDEGSSSTLSKHSELCDKLKLEARIGNEAWESFQALNKNFTLEGDVLHWLGCAIYAATWKASNYINFTNLLRHCNLSLGEFFSKIRHWSDMTNLQDQFSKRIDYLEKNVAVLCNVFNDYQVIFAKIFKTPDFGDGDVLKQQRNRKQKSVPCNSLKLFEFCWTLFITIKDEPNYNKDVVTLCRLIRAVCDWAFSNAFLANRRDLLNPNFDGLPNDWSSPEYTVPNEAPCIVNILSSNPENIFVKYIKEYEFKNSIDRFFRQDRKGVKEDFFDVLVFEQNFKNISNAYDTIFLARGDFDERIFLAEYRRTLLEKEHRHNVTAGDSLQCQDPAGDDSSSPEVPKEMPIGQSCLTPLTGRRYLSPREHTHPTGTSTESISRLNSLISERQPAPSEPLLQLFESCSRNPTESIREIVINLGNSFTNAYATFESKEVAEQRLQIAVTLFYKFIENILQNERKIQSDISAIVEKEVFYECMFACCLEIVIYSYNCRKRFPWILEILHIQAYNFVKVIELVIRSKDKLSRETIKHLSMIEESILSSLIWKTDSILWQAIDNSEKEIPKFEETALPGHLQAETNSEGTTLKTVLNFDCKEIQSPGPSATDRFQSPVPQSSALNRELFPQVQPTQSVLMIKDRSGNTRMIPIVNNEMQKAPPPVTVPRRTENTISNKPRRTGGLSILFRKFYNLAGERMEHLCTHLKITNTDTKRKIWTVFEELVRKNYCELIKDRDMDQLLLCAVYMICKLTKLNLSFAEIIKSYRSQPQATSDIYRKVLITRKATSVDNDGETIEVPENRGDLIHFYNTVIIQTMKKFVQKFVDKVDEPNSDVLLSPLPAYRGHVVHQVFDNIFVKPLESPTTLGLANGKVYNYYFNRSPSKDLKDINKAIKGNGVQGKRLLVEEESELPNTKRIANRKVQSLIEERRNQNTE